MTRVQFREEDELVSFVSARGINPNALAKRLFEEEVRRMQARDKFHRLAALRARPARSSAALVREDRDR